jgi:hypothetical protein
MTRQRLIGLGVLGAVLLHYPLLRLTDIDATVGGAPALVLYLFVVWAGLIAASAWLVRREG